MSENIEELLLLAQERFFEMGISPRDFRKNSMADIKDVLDIKNAWDQKVERERKINEALASMR